MKCDNCGRTFVNAGELAHRTWEVPDLSQKIGPGERLPLGDCPDCGALVHGETLEGEMNELARVRAEMHRLDNIAQTKVGECMKLTAERDVQRALLSTALCIYEGCCKGKGIHAYVEGDELVNEMGDWIEEVKNHLLGAIDPEDAAVDDMEDEMQAGEAVNKERAYWDVIFALLKGLTDRGIEHTEAGADVLVAQIRAIEKRLT